MTALFAVLAAALAAVSAYAFASGTSAPQSSSERLLRPSRSGSRRSRAQLFAAEGEETATRRRILFVVAQVDETQALWLDYRRTGDQKLRDRLILTYAPLVKYVAGRLGCGLPAHVDEGDLVSYGLLGLMGAIERYDPTREIKFETYAIARIKGQIIDELRAMDWVPRSVRARARDIERAIAELEKKLGRAPTDEEIAGKLGITTEELEDSLADIARSSIAALDELWTVSGGEGDQVALIDTIEDEGAPDPQGASRSPSRRRRSPRRSLSCPSARSSSSRSTTTRS